MSLAKMTLIGLEMMMESQNDSIFNGISLTDKIDKQTMIDSIMLRSGEFEVLYADPSFMKYSTNIWFRKNYSAFDRMAETLQASYNPLDNYDRHEEWTDDHTGDYKKNNKNDTKGTNNRTDDLTQTNDLTRTDDLTQTNDLASTNDVTTTNDVSAYNDSAYAPKDKQIVDQDGTDTGTVTNTGTVTDTGTVTNTGTVDNSYEDHITGNESGDDRAKDKHIGHLWGNIGVTSSMELVEKELNLRKDYNIYDIISDLFVAEFCLTVY